MVVYKLRVVWEKEKDMRVGSGLVCPKQVDKAGVGSSASCSSTERPSMTDDHGPFQISYSPSYLPATFLGSFCSSRNNE